jgi:hypothetical protein
MNSIVHFSAFVFLLLKQLCGREVWVGGSTYKSILAQRFLPGLLDPYLGKRGYDAQQYSGSPGPNRADNLWQPVAADAGAHGSFDDRARSSKPRAESNRISKMAFWVLV